MPVPATPTGASAAAGPLKATSAPAAVPEDVCGEAVEALEQARAEGRGAEPGVGLGSGSGLEDRGRSPREEPAPAVLSLAQLHGGDLPTALEGPAAALPAPRGRGAVGAGTADWSPDVAGAGRGEPDQAPAGPSSAASAASASTVGPPAAGAPDREGLRGRAPVRRAAPGASAADPRSAGEAESTAAHGNGRHEQAGLRSAQEATPLGNGPLQPPPAPAAPPSGGGSAASSASHAAGGSAGPVQERKQDAAELDRCVPTGALISYHDFALTARGRRADT